MSSKRINNIMDKVDMAYNQTVEQISKSNMSNKDKIQQITKLNKSMEDALMTDDERQMIAKIKTVIREAMAKSKAGGGNGAGIKLIMG